MFLDIAIKFTYFYLAIAKLFVLLFILYLYRLIMEYHEVAIVGGGPAGSTCASELAKNGVDVALFDHSHPREKPCGGAISGRIFEDFKFPKNIIERHIDWLILENQNGIKTKIFRKNMGIVVMRKKFDYYLFNQAKKFANIIEERVIDVKKDGNFWKIRTNDKKFKTKILIGADGCSSLVRKKVFKPIHKNLLGHCVGYHLPHKKEYIEKKFLNALELYFIGKPYVNIGYVWIFPKSEHVTIGIGARLGTENMKQSLDKFIDLHPAANRLSKISLRNIKIHSHLVPAISDANFFNLPTTGKNWILIGDAAGHVNPITGEGIYYAMTGGKLAAKSYLEGDIKLFEIFWRKKYGSDLYYGARLQKLFYNSNFTNKLIDESKKSKILQELILNVICPQVSYKDFLNKNLWKLFFIPFELIFRFIF
jgi:geranylgeranyl reductase family protein